MEIEGCVTFRSIAAFNDKPAVFTVGAIEAVTKNGRCFNLDWNSWSGDSGIDKTGHITFSVNLADFSATQEYYGESNLEVGIRTQDLTPFFIASSKLKEVPYECYLDSEEKIPVLLEVQFFSLSAWNTMDDSIIDYMEFPQVEIDRYNREEGNELNYSTFFGSFSNEKDTLDEIKAILETEKDNTRRISLIESVVSKYFEAIENEAVDYSSLDTILSYLLYCCRDNKSDYVIVREFADHYFESMKLLVKLS